MKILAKSFGTTLKEHTEDVLKAVESLKSSGKVKGEEMWWKLLKIAAEYHDAGKIWPPFQRLLGNDEVKVPEKISRYGRVPHSLLSVVFIPPDELTKFSEEDQKIVLSAVAFHHWRDSFKDYLMGSRGGDLKSAFSFILEKKDEILGYLKSEMGRAFLNEELALYLSEASFVESGIVFPPQILMFLPSFLQSDIAVAEKKAGELYRKYIFVKGNLLRADRFASAVEGSEGRLKIEDIEMNCGVDIEEKIVANLEGKTIRLWQKEVLEGKRGKNLVLVAPTGAGKTEFALIWGKGKTIFTLPIRSAASSIWMRILEYTEEGFEIDKLKTNSPKCVRLLHSSADVFIYERVGMDPSLEGEVWKLHETARYLSADYIVSTGDQIFPAAVKYPGYEMIYSVLMNSYLVVDEIQSYNPEAAAVVVKLLEDVSRLGGKFLLMTATLPSFIKEEIENRTGVKEFIDAYEFLKGFIPDPRSRVKVLIGDTDWMVEKAIKEMKKGKKVLLIRNTVKKAVETYKIVKELSERVLLLHSRMTLEDRLAVERELLEFSPESSRGDSVIFVSTQVAEASLNIDFDVLITDASPADSLVQRMGRVYRKRRYEGEGPNVYVVVEVKDGKLDVPRGVYEKNAVLKTIAYLAGEDLNIDEKKLIDILKSGTDEIELAEEKKKEMVEVVYNYLESKSVYKRHFDETLEVLDSGYIAENKREAQEIFRRIASIDVVPENLAMELLEELQRAESIYDVKITLLNRTVSIPLWSVTSENVYGLSDVIDIPKEFSNLLKDVLIAKGIIYEHGVGAIY